MTWASTTWTSLRFSSSGETRSTSDEPLIERWNGMSGRAATGAGSSDLAGVTTFGNGTALAVGSAFIGLTKQRIYPHRFIPIVSGRGRVR